MVCMDYHPVVETIKKVLTERGVAFETFEHEAVRTSEEAAKIRPGYTIDQGAKALIARIKKSGKGKRFVMFVLPGSKKFDTKKIKEHLGLSDVRFATEEEVGAITEGVLPGGVPPFGTLFGLEVYCDQSLFENEKIVFNAGDRRYSIAMRTDDYRTVVMPTVADIISLSR